MTNQNAFPDKFHLFPKVERVAKAVGGLFCMHLLSPVSDHEFKHDPLLSPDLPVKQWGTVPDLQGRDIGMNQMYDSSVETD